MRMFTLSVDYKIGGYLFVYSCHIINNNNNNGNNNNNNNPTCNAPGASFTNITVTDWLKIA